MNKFINISEKYLIKNKKRTISTIISITISAILIFTLFTLGMSLYDGLINECKKNGNYEVIFSNVSEESYKSLENHVNVKSLCGAKESSVILKQEKSEEKILKINSFININKEIFSYSVVEGAYPNNPYEIMLEKTSEFYLDKEYKVGDEITFEVNDGYAINEKTFKISGFFEKENSSVRSNEFLGITLLKENISDLKVYLNFKDNKDIRSSSEKIAQDYSIKISSYNEELLYFLNQGKKSNGIFSAAISLALIVVLISEIIIKATINISILQRTKDFGILRCLGASKAHLKKLVIKECIILSLISITTGITISVIALKISNIFIDSKFMKINFYPSIFILTIILTIIGLFLSLNSSAKLLNKITPLEGVGSNYFIKKEKFKKRNGTLYKKIFGFEGEYAYKSAMRNKGKFVPLIIIFTLSIGTFVGANGILNSVKIYSEQYYKDLYYINSYYDMYVGINTDLQRDVDINKCINEIRSLKEVEVANKVNFNITPNINENITYTDEYIKNVKKLTTLKNKYHYIYAYNYDEMQLLNIVEGSINGGILKDNEIVICNYEKYKNNNGEVKECKRLDINIGDEVYLVNNKSLYTEGEDNNFDLKVEKAKELFKNGNYKKFKVVAIAKENTIDGDKETVIVSEKTFSELFPKDTLTSESINIKLKDPTKFNELKKYLDKNYQYEYYEFYNGMYEDLSVINNVKKYTNIITIFICLICIFNIINTIISNQAMRKKEFSILRAFGMSKKKLYKVIILERSVISIVSSIIGVFLGNVIGYLIVNMILDFTYKVPVEAIITSIIFLAICIVILSVLTIVKYKNESIVDDISDI